MVCLYQVVPEELAPRDICSTSAGGVPGGGLEHVESWCCSSGWLGTQRGWHSLMGYHSEAGLECSPITPDLVIETFL